MDFDFRRRCVVREVDHERIYYGLTAAEHAEIFGQCGAVDVAEEYGRFDEGGRLRAETEHERQKHFFNKRIEVRYDDSVSPVRGDHAGEVRYGAGRTHGTIQAEVEKRRAGDGGADASDFTEETCPGHVASPDDPKTCDRCGTHIDSLRPDEESWT